MSNNSPRRREFLASAAAAPLILSSSAKGANERITFALIGAGGRGRRVTQAFIEFGGAKLLSVCDVYKPNLEKGLEIGGADAKGYVDYKEVLAHDDIDAVLIATPDHHHAPMLIDAVKAIYLDFRAEDRLTRKTIQTQLEAAKWPAFAAIPR